MGRRPPHKNNPPSKPQSKPQSQQPQPQPPPPDPASTPSNDDDQPTNPTSNDTINALTPPHPPINPTNATNPSTASLQSAAPSPDDLAWSIYHSGMMFEFDLHSHDAVACWELSERRGFQHAPTRFKLAQSHLHGFNYSPDSEKALHYFQLAAAQGHDEAAAHIALFHLTGLHSPQSALEAYNLLHARAEAGCAPSMFWLSAISLSGVKFALKAAGLDKFLPSVTQDLSNDEFVATFNPDKDAERE